MQVKQSKKLRIVVVGGTGTWGRNDKFTPYTLPRLENYAIPATTASNQLIIRR